MVVALPSDAQTDADDCSDWLEDAWSELGFSCFDCSPQGEGLGYYADCLPALGREGVLSVVREILAERGAM